MRYYSIVIQDKDGKAPPGFSAVPDAAINGATFTSFANGQTDPGALDVEMDLMQALYHAPAGGSQITIWGISLQQIGQAANLNGMSVSVYGGMQAGLPLANPAQAGLLVQGKIYQAFGNWTGTTQTLDLVIVADSGTAGPQSAGAKPANIAHSWQKNTPMSGAIQTALQTAFPGLKIAVNIDSKLTQALDDFGYYLNLTQYAQYINEVSKAIMNSSTYQGVMMAISGKNLVVSDGTKPQGTGTQSSPKVISYQDLIGQPTWIGLQQIQLKTVMRGDLNLLDYITLPPSIATTTASSFSQFRTNSAFQGTFQIQQLRHVGRFRQPDGMAWNTTIDVLSSMPAGSAMAPSATVN